jgi:hypothetical protein
MGSLLLLSFLSTISMVHGEVGGLHSADDLLSFRTVGFDFSPTVGFLNPADLSTCDSIATRFASTKVLREEAST